MNPFSFPTAVPTPNQVRAPRSTGGEMIPAPLDLMERSAPLHPGSPLAELVPFKRRTRYDGV